VDPRPPPHARVRRGMEAEQQVALRRRDDDGTPFGEHKVLLKGAKKVSPKYNNAPMPWSLKFTNDYCAIHGTGAAVPQDMVAVGRCKCRQPRMHRPDNHAEELYN
jgi:hypothetical protein